MVMYVSDRIAARRGKAGKIMRGKKGKREEKKKAYDIDCLQGVHVQ
jgi:hypothetical protein